MAARTKADPVMDFLVAVTEMCEAWDELRAALDGSDEDLYRIPIEEGRVEMVRRTKRMADARVLVARAATRFGELLS